MRLESDCILFIGQTTSSCSAVSNLFIGQTISSCGAVSNLFIGQTTSSCGAELLKHSRLLKVAHKCVSTGFCLFSGQSRNCATDRELRRLEGTHDALRAFVLGWSCSVLCLFGVPLVRFTGFCTGNRAGDSF